MPSSGLDFELAIEPNPRIVSVVRRFVEETFEKQISDPDAVFRVAMTTHELLENAAKYAAAGKALLRVRLENAGDGSVGVHLSLTNATTPHHVDRLRERIAAIGSSNDPQVHYQTLMKETATIQDESGLGLARICAEGEMSLRAEVNGDMVTIFASARLRGALS